MAVSGEVQIGRINRFFTKWLGSKGSSPRMTIGGELIGVIPLWSGVENRFLESWNRFTGTVSIAGVSAVVSNLRIRNPTLATMVVLEKFNVISATANDIPTWGIQAATTDLTTLAGATAITRLDARGQQNSAMIISSQTGAVVFNGSFRFGAAVAFQSTELILTDDQEITIAPGDALQISTANVNSSIYCSWIWRERTLEDSELK